MVLFWFLLMSQSLLSSSDNGNSEICESLGHKGCRTRRGMRLRVLSFPNDFFTLSKSGNSDQATDFDNNDQILKSNFEIEQIEKLYLSPWVRKRTPKPCILGMAPSCLNQNTLQVQSCEGEKEIISLSHSLSLILFFCFFVKLKSLNDCMYLLTSTPEYCFYSGPHQSAHCTLICLVDFIFNYQSILSKFFTGLQ